MNIARWIGARAADVVTFFRDKPFIPCQIDWYAHNVDALIEIRPGEEYIDTDEFFGDVCGDCTTSCCIATDTIGEFEGKA